jgi:hypothetical protein
VALCFRCWLEKLLPVVQRHHLSFILLLLVAEVVVETPGVAVERVDTELALHRQQGRQHQNFPVVVGQ